MTFPREGKFTSSHFFASKDVMGNLHGSNSCNCNCNLATNIVL